MSTYRSRTAARPRQPAPPQLAEITLTIPDALVAWAQDTDRQLAWPRPYGQEVAQLLQEAPLSPAALERLLSRLEPIVSAARAAGRHDLLVGFDTQTSEWLGLHIHAETSRGHLHVGPDPRTQAFEGASEPPWTYSEVRVVHDAVKGSATSEVDARAAVDLAWAAKQLLLDVFPTARISDLAVAGEPVRCVACGEAAGGVMMAAEGGHEYHAKCWSEMTSSRPLSFKKVAR